MSSDSEQVVSGKRPEKRELKLDTQDKDANSKFIALEHLCEEYAKYVEKYNRSNEDIKQFMFETAMEMFYGDNIWKYLNERM